MTVFEYLTRDILSIVYIKDEDNNVLFKHLKYDFKDLENKEQTIEIDGVVYETTAVDYDGKTLYFTSSQTVNHIEFEESFKFLTEAMDIGVALLKGGDVIYRNPSLFTILDLPQELLTRRPWMKLQRQYARKMLQLISGDIGSAEILMDLDKTTTPKWLLITRSDRTIGVGDYIILTIKDITDIKDKELRFNQQQVYLNNIIESMFEGVIVTDEHYRITIINEEAKKLIGIESGYGKHIHEVLRLFDKHGYPVQYLNEPEFKSNDVEIETASGLNYYVNVRIRDLYEHNVFSGKIISFFEITEEKKREQEVLYLTYHDILTGLHNRTFFEEQLRIMDTSRKLPLSVILGDVNGLKLTNDVFGHEAGDLLLKRIARVLRSTCRHEDIVSRWGGDEFIILLPNTTENQVQIVMNRIIVEIESIYSTDSSVQSILPSLSLGYGVKETEEQDIYTVIKIAENNMYKRKMLTNSSIYSSIISSMTNALYERSSETEEHANRLYEFCYAIAKEFNLSESELSDLELFAKLHDIGKIGIPDEILNKPEKLTKEEWLVMKKHPEIGFRIANTTQELKGVAKYILAHHEHFDGNGYPKQLKGSDIPLLSRILSVVDAYDAMTHNRPYRGACTNQEALNEIKKNSGTQFDPAVVNVFVKIIEQ